MSRKELERLVQAMADGTLSETEFATLQEELAASAEARAFFRESMEIELLLRSSIGTKFSLPASGHRMEALLRRQQRSHLRLALVAAVIALIVSAAVFHRVFIKVPDSSVRIAFTSGTSWTGEIEGDALEHGRTMQVEFGVAEVTLPQGVRGIIEGPARFRVGNANDMELLEGRAWFRVEEAARGFRLRTPQVEVTDLGTEFAVVTRDNELDVVHVFQGRVRAAARFGLKMECALSKGEAAEVSPVGRWIERESDDSGFLTTLPPELPGIRFGFNSENPLRAEGAHPAVDSMVVTRIGGGMPELVDGVRGKALAVRSFEDVITTDWPGIGGVEPRTIACWIRRNPDASDYASVVSWGVPDEDLPGRCKLLVAESPGRGHAVLRFSLGHHVHFSGSTPLQADRWHHIAVVFRGLHSDRGEMVELYVDGQKERVDPEFSQPPREDQKLGTIIDSKNSSPLRIGTGPETDAPHPFLGEIDDVYVLPRALVPREVQALMALE
ncbi:LamG-like jellyroll fold domain-containing protein [Haloferula sp. A504]|uniref:LamG-like jellyroll fold domain-containing protein n=1 Tax=Haloferula sp. A504 TaxID=3373601 RepID=UPI0031C54D16|nr:FecR domain-containing protein [Verrucomicrobiaceae bacterium E54]